MDETVIAQAVARERLYQDAERGTLAENPHTLATWLRIAGGELAEAIAAERTGRSALALCEVVQCAAVLFAIIEQHGLVERNSGLLEE